MLCVRKGVSISESAGAEAAGHAFDKLSGNGNFTLGIFNENVAKWVPRTVRAPEKGTRWSDSDVTLWMRFDMTNMCVLGDGKLLEGPSF